MTVAQNAAVEPCDNSGNCQFVGKDRGLTWEEGGAATVAIDTSPNVGFGQRGTMKLVSQEVYNVGKIFIFDVRHIFLGVSCKT